MNATPSNRYNKFEAQLYTDNEELDDCEEDEDDYGGFDPWADVPAVRY